MNDIARQVPPQSDMTLDRVRRIPIKEVLPRFRAAGLPRDIRSLQRYCESGLLDGIKELTATGETWFIARDSIEPAIIQLKQMHSAKSTGQTTTVPEAPVAMSPPVAVEIPNDTGHANAGQRATPSDTDDLNSPDDSARHGATGDDAKPDTSPYVAQL